MKYGRFINPGEIENPSVARDYSADKYISTEYDENAQGLPTVTIEKGKGNYWYLTRFPFGWRITYSHRSIQNRKQEAQIIAAAERFEKSDKFKKHYANVLHKLNPAIKLSEREYSKLFDKGGKEQFIHYRVRSTGHEALALRFAGERLHPFKKRVADDNGVGVGDVEIIKGRAELRGNLLK